MTATHQMKQLTVAVNRLLCSGLLGALLLSALSGCTTWPQADAVGYKDSRTMNNAALNNVAVVPTSFVVRDGLARTLRATVGQMESATVLSSGSSVFVAATFRGAAGSHLAPYSTNFQKHMKLNRFRLAQRPLPAVANSQSIVNTIAQVVRRSDPHAERVYIANDPTLVTHFHMFAGDRRLGQPTGSAVILDDIDRVFPHASYQMDAD